MNALVSTVKTLALWELLKGLRLTLRNLFAPEVHD